LRNPLDRVPRRWLYAVYAAGLVLITLALAWIAYRAMFNMFDVPDDDGYLLMSLRKFNAGGSLYSQVYSQYGPGEFVILGSILRAAGVALTNDGARAVNLTLWLGSTLLIGLSLLRLTRKFTISAAGLLVGFLLLKADANEPLHPGATIGFLLVAIVTAAVFLLPRRPRAALAVVGALAATLLSIKVNVGVFALLGVGFACVATVPVLRRLFWLRLLASWLLVALPFLLLSEHLGDADTLRFAGIVAIGVLCLVAVAARLPETSVVDGRGVVALVAGAAAVIVLVSLVVVVTGTSPHDLAEGWVVRPSKTPGIQWVPLLIDHLSWFIGGAALVAVTAVAWLWGRPLAPGWQALLGALRIVAGLVIWVSLTGPIFHLPVNLTQATVLGASLLWLAALDPRGPAPQTSFLRLLIPALASLQFLHAYPVPGSQIYWATLLLVVVGGIILNDGVDQVATVARGWQPSFSLWPAVAVVPVVLFGVWFVAKPLRTEARTARATYNAGVSLDLTGARDMHVDPALANQIEELTTGIERNCDTFMTIPAMNSLNIFSGEEPPFELAGPWPFFVNTDEQQHIVETVKKIPRFCVIAKPDLLDFWAGFSDNHVPNRPLVRYMHDEFKTLHDYSGYYLLVRKDEPRDRVSRP
jgi:hypothetical protein